MKKTMKKTWNTPEIVKLGVSKTETGTSHHCEYLQPGNPGNGKWVGTHGCPGAPGSS